jgi:hypothetical protein
LIVAIRLMKDDCVLLFYFVVVVVVWLFCAQPVYEQVFPVDRHSAIVAADYACEPGEHMGSSHCHLRGVGHQRSLGRLWPLLLGQGVQ